MPVPLPMLPTTARCARGRGGPRPPPLRLCAPTPPLPPPRHKCFFCNTSPAAPQDVVHLLEEYKRLAKVFSSEAFFILRPALHRMLRMLPAMRRAL